MKLTPLDVRKQSFRKTMRGFDPEEVRVFLEMVADEYEQLLQQNGMLNERVRNLSEQLDRYHCMERTLQNSLLTAERVGEEARERSHLEAETIIEDARIRAERILEDSRERLRMLKREVQDLRRQKDLFAQRFESFLEAQTQFLHSHQEEMGGLDGVDARTEELLVEATRSAPEADNEPAASPPVETSGAAQRNVEWTSPKPVAQPREGVSGNPLRASRQRRRERPIEASPPDPGFLSEEQRESEGFFAPGPEEGAQL